MGLPMWAGNQGLICASCGKRIPLTPSPICSHCHGPLSKETMMEGELT